MIPNNTVFTIRRFSGVQNLYTSSVSFKAPLFKDAGLTRWSLSFSSSCNLILCWANVPFSCPHEINWLILQWRYLPSFGQGCTTCLKPDFLWINPLASVLKSLCHRCQSLVFQTNCSCSPTIYHKSSLCTYPSLSQEHTGVLHSDSLLSNHLTRACASLDS